jgi:hypothetical protein
MRKVWDFVRQWGLWIFGLLFAATIVLNWETWLTANNFDQLWRTIPQSGGSAARDYPAWNRIRNFIVGPHVTGFVLGALVFGLVSLLGRGRSTLHRAQVRAALQGVRDAKVHTPHKEEQSAVYYGLGKITDIKSRFHKSPAMQFLLSALTSVVRGVYDGKYGLDKREDLRRFLTLCDRVELLLKLPPWLNRIVAWYLGRKTRRELDKS